jgi:hypothetical protein
MSLLPAELAELMETGMKHPQVKGDSRIFIATYKREHGVGVDDLCFANALGSALVGKFEYPAAAVKAVSTVPESLGAYHIQDCCGIAVNIWRIAAYLLDIPEQFAEVIDKVQAELSLPTRKVIKQLRDGKLREDTNVKAYLRKHKLKEKH